MRLGLLWLSLLWLTTVRADAQSLDEALDPTSLQVHGFVSQGFLVTSDNNYLAESTRGSFEFTEVGINFTKSLTQDLRLGVQLFSRDLGPLGNYNIKADWFYLDYHFRDWLGFRAGRVKLPFGLYNEISDIDSARVPILLPQSTYSIQDRDYLLAQTGAQIYGYVSLGGAGALDYRLYGGTIFVQAEPNPYLPYRITDVSVPYVVGGRLMYEAPLEGLRLGGSIEALRLDVQLAFDADVWMPLQMMGALPDGFAGSFMVELPVVLWTSSIEYAAHEWQIAVEYGRWHASSSSHVQALFPDQAVDNERLYGLIAYRINDWFVPAAYYSLYFPNVDDRSGRDSRQQDFSLTARFDLNQHWLIKLEVHYLNGTAALSSALNDGRSLRALTRDWVMFLAKTTAYF